MQAEITVPRGRVLAVLLANGVLWVGALVMTGNWMLGGGAAIALISIASLLAVPRKR